MKMVMKGNKQLRVPDERVEAMLAQGYSEVDAKTGKVIKEPKQDEVKALKKEIQKQDKEIQVLEKENKALKAEVETLKAQLEEAKKEA